MTGEMKVIYIDPVQAEMKPKPERVERDGRTYSSWSMTIDTTAPITMYIGGKEVGPDMKPLYDDGKMHLPTGHIIDEYTQELLRHALEPYSVVKPSLLERRRGLGGAVRPEDAGTLFDAEGNERARE